MTNRTIEEIQWLDAQSGFSSPQSIEELAEEEAYLTVSVGYLLHEDKEKVILGFMIFSDGVTVKHWQMIPKGISELPRPKLRLRSWLLAS